MVRKAVRLLPLVPGFSWLALQSAQPSFELQMVVGIAAPIALLILTALSLGIFRPASRSQGLRLACIYLVISGAACFLGATLWPLRARVLLSDPFMRSEFERLATISEEGSSPPQRLGWTRI